MKTVPDKCPFCESPIMSHVGNLLVSEDGGFGTYKCKTTQDITFSDDQWKRTGQSDGCRRREVQLLTKQRDEARERIKRLEEAGNKLEYASAISEAGEDPNGFEKLLIAQREWRKARGEDKP